MHFPVTRLKGISTPKDVSWTLNSAVEAVVLVRSESADSLKGIRRDTFSLGLVRREVWEACSWLPDSMLLLLWILVVAEEPDFGGRGGGGGGKFLMID